MTKKKSKPQTITLTEEQVEKLVRDAQGYGAYEGDWKHYAEETTKEVMAGKYKWDE